MNESPLSDDDFHSFAVVARNGMAVTSIRFRWGADGFQFVSIGTGCHWDVWNPSNVLGVYMPTREELTPFGNSRHNSSPSSVLVCLFLRTSACPMFNAGVLDSIPCITPSSRPWMDDSFSVPMNSTTCGVALPCTCRRLTLLLSFQNMQWFSFCDTRV